MSVYSILNILWRRRIVVVPALVLGLLMCTGVIMKAPPTYRSSGSVVLLNPPALPVVTPQNPSIPPEFQNAFVRFGDISVVVDVLVRVLQSQPVNDNLEAIGFEGTAEIAANRDFYRGPIIDVAAEADTAEQAIADANLLIAELTDQLDGLQTDTAETYRIRPAVVVSPDRATRVFSGTLRLLILAVGASGALVVGSGLLADRILSDDRSRKSLRRGLRPSPSAPVTWDTSVRDPDGSEPHLVIPLPAQPTFGPEPADEPVRAREPEHAVPAASVADRVGSSTSDRTSAARGSSYERPAARRAATPAGKRPAERP